MGTSALSGELTNTSFTKSVGPGGAIGLFADEARNGQILFIGALTSNSTVTFPVTAAERQIWEICNDTTGAFTLTVAGPTGRGVSIPQGATVRVSYDGTNFAKAAEPLRVTSPELRVLTNGGPHSRRITLISGAANEVWASQSNTTVTADLVNFRLGTQGHLFTQGGAVTASSYYRALLPTDPIVLSEIPASIGVFVYLPAGDEAKITNFTIHLYSNSGESVSWSRSITSGFVAGWNHFRWAATDGTLTGFGTIYAIRIIAVTNAAQAFTVGQVYAEVRPRASILMMGDRPYQRLLTDFLPQWRAMRNPDGTRLPISFNIDATLLGTGTTPNVAASEAELMAMRDDEDVFYSIHGYDGTATSAMTAAQLQADHIQAVLYCQQKLGLTIEPWRGAFVQNLATNHAALQNILLAYASPTASSSLTTFPFPTPFNIPRIALHGLAAATVDAHFANLALTKGVMVCYTHAIDAAGGNNMTPTERDYFLAKVAVGLNAGWLEAVSFTTLMARAGLKYRNAQGEMALDYRNALGLYPTTPLALL